MREAISEWWRYYGSDWRIERTEPGTIPPSRFEIAAIAVIVLAFASFAALVVGVTVVSGLRAAGLGVPVVHDDPNRVEWAGLALFVGYGLATYAITSLLLVVARRALFPSVAPARVRARAGWLAGLTLLMVITAGLAVELYDGRGDVFAWLWIPSVLVAFAALTIRTLREGPTEEGELPASFDEPVRLLDPELPPAVVREAQVRPRRPFSAPDATAWTRQPARSVRRPTPGRRTETDDA